jgi:peptidoglycan/xylan/chitin deacetylase (PgdA/CDA1 family)
MWWWRLLRRTGATTLLLMVTIVAAIPFGTLGPAGAVPSEASVAAKPVVHFTFDDGPDSRITGRILDILARYDARATFFVAGSRVPAYPAVARRIVDEGHAIANHSYSHPVLTSLSSAGVLAQFTDTNAVISQVTGIRPSCYRPPYGAVNARVHDLAVQAGLPNAEWTTGSGSHYGLWDIDTLDWQQNYSRTWYELSKVSAGDVVLMHSLRSFSADVFGQWMAANAHRFDFQPLPGCGARTEPPLPSDPARWYRYQVARLYLAYFDRRPDEDGARYWNTLYARGRLTLVEISDYFARSAEFDRRYDLLTDGQFVRLVYRNVLNRDPDPEGGRYWTELLTSGRLTRGELMVQFSESAEFVRLAAPEITGPAWDGDPASSYERGIEMDVLPGPEP